MQIRELGIRGAWIVQSSVFQDTRGSFREWFKSGDIEEVTGQNFPVRQANVSISKRGVIRGIHYSLAASGQSKWVTCVSGSIWDVVVDIRPSSPTFMQWIGTTLHSDSGTSILVSSGLGHGFLSLDEDSVVSYLLTSPYSPIDEFVINPLDSELKIDWPAANPLLSKKDSTAVSLSAMHKAGKLPN
jgi:dTDP-4-dehydrorhamnose 3,5-epimerase